MNEATQVKIKNDKILDQQVTPINANTIMISYPLYLFKWRVVYTYTHAYAYNPFKKDTFHI